MDAQLGAHLAYVNVLIEHVLEILLRQAFMQVMVLRRAEDIGKVVFHKPLSGRGTLAHHSAAPKYRQGIFGRFELVDDGVLRVYNFIVVGV